MKFRKAPALTVVILVLFSFTAYGQTRGLQTGDLNYRSYYYDYKLLNPALAGMKDKHIINTVYSGFPSGFDGAPKLLYASYEASIPSIKSGIGALVAYDAIGSYETYQGAVFFNRKIAFNERSGLRAGTRISYRHDESDFSGLDLATDPGEDPTSGFVNETTNSVNFDFGVLYYSSIVNLGASIKDVIKQDNGREATFNAIVSREFIITKNFKADPSVVYATDFEDYSLDINTIFEIRQWLLLGAGYYSGRGNDDVSFNAGVNIKDWVQIIAHIYSSSTDKMRGASDPRRLEIMVRVNIPHHKAKK